jgi:hypothetical protein
MPILGAGPPKRGRKALFVAAIFEERFNTIEWVFAWEDKFPRLLNRFDRISQLHYAFKTLAYFPRLVFDFSDAFGALFKHCHEPPKKQDLASL